MTLATLSTKQGADMANTTRESAERPKHALIDRQAFLACLQAMLEQFCHELPTPNSSEFEPWITVADGADYAAVSEDTLREWISRGWLPNARVGRVQRVRRSDIDDLFRSGISAVPANDQEVNLPRSAEILEKIKARGDG